MKHGVGGRLAGRLVLLTLLCGKLGKRPTRRRPNPPLLSKSR